MIELPAVATEHERALWSRYAQRIFAYGVRHLRDTASANDLVQHVLLAVMQALRAGRVADPARLDAYVLGTCHHAAQEMRRGEGRRRRLAELADAEQASDPRYEWTEHDRMRLETCVRALEPRDRAVVVATFMEERDSADIARALGLSVGNVRVIRHRALARLLACMEGGAV